MDHRDLEAWEPEEPSKGFAERVVAAARREETRRSSGSACTGRGSTRTAR
jgi:hypothetical protein